MKKLGFVSYEGSRKYYGFEQHYIEIQTDVVIVSYEVIKENH